MNHDESSARIDTANNEALTTTCPHCGNAIEQISVVTAMPPVSPAVPELLYDVKVAAELIPYRPVHLLLQWLARRKAEFPARYRTVYFGCRAKSTRVRVLSTSEIWRIRKQVLSGPGAMTQ